MGSHDFEIIGLGSEELDWGAMTAEKIVRIGLGGNRAAASFWKVCPRGLKSDAARVDLDDGKYRTYEEEQ